MIETIVCFCGKKWQLQPLKLGILQEKNYFFHCTCGVQLADPERMAEMVWKKPGRTAFSEEDSKKEFNIVF
jgi:hypothetical protein